MRLLGRYLNSETETKKIRDLIDRARSEHQRRGYSPATRAPARLTVEQNAEIVELYKAGWAPKQIAETVGATEWTVHHRLNRNGIMRRPLGMTKTEVDEALRLNNAGVPITELCKRFGRSWKTVAKELKAARQSRRL